MNRLSALSEIAGRDGKLRFIFDDAYIFSGADALIVSPFYSYLIAFLYFFSFIFLHPKLIKFRGLFLATNLLLVLSAFTHGFSVSSPLFSVTGGLYFIIVGMLAGMGKQNR